MPSDNVAEPFHPSLLELLEAARRVESRAMDYRLRYDAERLRSILTGCQIGSQLSCLIEAAQREREA
jgi:hypothetical protein